MKIIGKMTGLRLLEEIANNNLSCGTMIRYKRDDVMLMSNPPQPVYEYYKYTAGDKRFHRCDEKGKLGAKGQQRFMNYGTLKKEFEIVETIVDEPLEDLMPFFEEEQDIKKLDRVNGSDLVDLQSNSSLIEQNKAVTNLIMYLNMNVVKINELVRAVNELRGKYE